MDRFHYIRNPNHHYLNTPLRKDTILERDLIFVTEQTWKYLNQRYRGDEIKRYAV